MMTVELLNDQTLVTDDTVCVGTGGIYDETDLVGCYHIEDQTKEIVFAHQANYIATGQCA